MWAGRIDQSDIFCVVIVAGRRETRRRVANPYIAAKTSSGSARMGLFTLLLCNHAHPRWMAQPIY